MKDNHPERTRVQQNQKYYHKDLHIKRWIVILLLIILLGILAYTACIYFQARNAANRTYDPKTAVRAPKGEFNGKRPFAVLLLGTDTGAFDRHEKKGNTDTMMIAVVNPQQKRYSLMSIPRDTVVKLEGTSRFQCAKINSAYPTGGAKMAMATVSKLVNVPIKYYAVVNMGGIMKMIKYVGGIEVDPKLSFEYDGDIFKKGHKRHVMGKAALSYSRMRYDDPRGDYGREERQREVITKLIKKAVSINSLRNLDQILTSISGNVKTNLSFDSLRAIAINYRKCSQNEDSDYMHGIGTIIHKEDYQVQPTKELQRVSDYLRSELGLRKEKLRNNETWQNELNSENGFDFSGQKIQHYHIYDYAEGEDQ